MELFYSKNCIGFLIAGCLIFTSRFKSQADIITTTSGRIYYGNVVQTNANEALILADYGTFSLPANIIQSVVPELDKRPVTKSRNSVSTPGRLPAWNILIAKLADKAWASHLKQIPATVITNGILKNVPYISFRCGEDYEFNIYGDLDNPAGIEVGLYRSLLTKDYAKDNVLAFVASVLPPADQMIIKALNRKKDLVAANGATFEITPETDEDAYGGWWLTVYDLKALDQARATDDELKQISVLNKAIIQEDAAGSSGWSKSDLRNTKAVVAALPVSAYTNSGADYSSYGDVLPQHNHGSVYVHSYERQDGTYVHAYTRRR